MRENIIIDNQIQGLAAKVVLGFAFVGFVVTVIRINDSYREKKNRTSR